MNNYIDFRSDTVTKPSKLMLEAMFSAKVGDDVFEEDETVNALESKIAQMFGMQDSLFCPSGTMTNQIATNVHVKPGEEVICSRQSHIYNYEGGGIAKNSGASVRLIESERGLFTAKDVVNNINEKDIHLAQTALVSVENTSNRGGGVCFNFRDMEEIKSVCDEFDLKYHIDGARLFNAIIKNNESPKQYGSIFDSISICFSKSLGCPVGSVLLGSGEFIRNARRTRKVFGGGMRQVGYLAAACIFALDNNIQRLKDDHIRAEELAKHASEYNYVKSVITPETNIVIFYLEESTTPDYYCNKLKSKGILAIPFGKDRIRMVTHLDINDSDIEKTINVMKNL